MGFISHQFLLHTYIDNTNRYPQDSKREHEYDCHEELFGIFYKKSAKRSNKFWSDHDSSSISKRNVYFGFFFFMSLWYTYSQRVSKEEQLVPAAIRLIITVETCQMINSFQRFNLSLFPLIRVWAEKNNIIHNQFKFFIARNGLNPGLNLDKLNFWTLPNHPDLPTKTKLKNFILPSQQRYFTYHS